MLQVCVPFHVLIPRTPINEQVRNQGCLASIPSQYVLPRKSFTFLGQVSAGRCSIKNTTPCSPEKNDARIITCNAKKLKDMNTNTTTHSILQ